MRIHPQTIPELDASLKSAKTAVKLLEESLREARAADRAARACIGNRERIAGWTGPAGWRLQTYTSKTVTCTCCKKQISAGEQHVGWRIPAFPAPGDRRRGRPRGRSEPEVGARAMPAPAGSRVRGGVGRTGASSRAVTLLGGGQHAACLAEGDLVHNARRAEGAPRTGPLAGPVVITGEDKYRCHVTFFKASGKFYASGEVRLPDHWEVCGGPAEQLLAYVAPRQNAVVPECVLRREFHMVLDPATETHDNPEVRYLYPRMIVAKAEA